MQIRHKQKRGIFNIFFTIWWTEPMIHLIYFSVRIVFAFQTSRGGPLLAKFHIFYATYLNK